MTWALLDKSGTIVELRSQPFPVSATLRWVEVGVDVQVGDRWEYGVHIPKEQTTTPVPTTITFVQLLRQAAGTWFTAAEARTWARREALPARVQEVLDSLPTEDDKLDAELTLLALTAIDRDNPLLVMIAQAYGADVTVLEDFFTQAARL